MGRHVPRGISCGFASHILGRESKRKHAPSCKEQIHALHERGLVDAKTAAHALGIRYPTSVDRAPTAAERAIALARCTEILDAEGRLRTGDTITDAEIEALRSTYNVGSVSYDLCTLALTPNSSARFEKTITTREARGRVAEILTRRDKET